ncbi:MAG: hypothetical protein QOG49_109, partial [Frankiaceae bacterium]|nr:hypothetical protein [Frankiaceae bacterium]
MITAKLFGGLGNQMFQYAAGRAAALRSGTQLALDVSWFGAQELRGFALAAMPIEAHVLPVDHAAHGVPAGWTGSGRLLRVRLGAAGLARRRPLLVERTPGVYDPRVKTAGDRAMLVGYWQSERYFVSAASEIRREL